MTAEEKKDKPELPPDLAKKVRREIESFPSDHYAEIGRVVASWTYLERLIDLVIWKLNLRRMAARGPLLFGVEGI